MNCSWPETLAAQKQTSAKKQTELTPEMAEEMTEHKNPFEKYVLPDLDLLSHPEPSAPAASKEDLYANGTHLEQTLEQFGVKAKVIDIHPGPVITRYDLREQLRPFTRCMKCNGSLFTVIKKT